MSGVQLNKIWTGKLGEVLPIKYGKSLPAKLRDASGIVPVYGSSGRVGVHSEAITQGPALIVGRKGSVGSVYFSNEPCWPIDTAYYTEAVEGQDIRYFKYLLDSLHLKRLDKSTAIPGLSRDDYNALTVAIAPIEEQRKIVAEFEKQFSRLDEAVANLKRVKANLKRYKAAVLKAAVEGRLVPTEAELARKAGRSFETGALLLSQLLENRKRDWSGRNKYLEPLVPALPLGSASPEGWAWATVDQISDFVTKGTTPAAEKLFDGSGDVQFLKVYNLTFDGTLNSSYKSAFISRETHEEALVRSKVKPGDVLINIVGPPLGQVSIVPNALAEANINQAIARIRPLLPLDPRFIAMVLMCEDIMRWAIRRAKTTVGQMNLTLELCRALPVPLPPLAEQARILAETERRLLIVRGIETQVEVNLIRAKRLRQTVLARVFAAASNSAIRQDTKRRSNVSA